MVLKIMLHHPEVVYFMIMTNSLHIITYYVLIFNDNTSVKKNVKIWPLRKVVTSVVSQYIEMTLLTGLIAFLAQQWLISLF